MTIVPFLTLIFCVEIRPFYRYSVPHFMMKGRSLLETDSLFFDFFHAHPHELIRLLQLQVEGHWAFRSISIKRFERRFDGVLERLDQPDEPVFVEFQGYRDPTIYWRVFHAITGWFLGQPPQRSLGRHFTGYVIFLDQRHDPGDPPLLAQPPHRFVSTTLKKVLQDLDDPGRLVVLEPLVLDNEQELLERLPVYRQTVDRLNLSPEALKLLKEQLAHAIVSRFSAMSYKEIERMLTYTPLRKTRAVQEIVAEERAEVAAEVTEAVTKEVTKAVTQEVTLRVQQKNSQNYLLLVWEARFGPPESWVTRRITTCIDIQVLESLMRSVAKAETVEEAEAQVKAALGNGV